MQFVSCHWNDELSLCVCVYFACVQQERRRDLNGELNSTEMVTKNM